MTSLCVFAGSSVGARQEYRTAAADLGRTLARRGVRVVFGGGRIGLMGVLADAALAAGGEVVGVIPGALVSREVAHHGLSDLRIVGSMHERKALMGELSDGFVALPGGWGTLEEFFEVLTWAQLGLHGKPCAVLNVGGYFDGLLTFLTHAMDEAFVSPAYARMLLVEDDADRVLDRMGAYEAPKEDKVRPAAALVP